MNNEFKVYNLSIPGIGKKSFENNFYSGTCEKIQFSGIINEQKIISKKNTDYITLAPKFIPHSDYELMLQSTDSIIKSPITSLSNEAIDYIFNTGYNFIEFLSNKDVINKYELNDGYPYLVFNYDEFTTDRHSGMSKKPFHLHLNSWTKNTINNIKQIDKNRVSSFYYESVVDPIFDITQVLARDALNCDELKDYIEPVKVFCGNQEISYSSLYKIKKGWAFLKSEELATILKTIHEKLEKRYVEILECFTGQKSIPELYTRHIILPKNVILNNILKSDMQESTKSALVILIDKVRNITPEQFREISKDSDYRDSVIPLRWLAYSIGMFSNTYIKNDKPYVDQPLYMNVTPRLYTKIGGASIMNFPDYSLVKIDRGKGYVDSDEFEKKMEFHRQFAKTIGIRSS